MPDRIRPLVNFAAAFGETWATERPARQAAALAYYSMFSLAPALIIALVVADIFIDQAAVIALIVDRISATVGAETAEFLQSMVVSAYASATAQRSSPVVTLVSLGALLYAATGFFAQLKYSLNAIFDVPVAQQLGFWHFLKTRLLAFLFVIGLGVLFTAFSVLSVVIGLVISYLPVDGLPALANFALFFVTGWLSFALLYRVLPDRPVRWVDALVGSASAAVLLVLGRAAVGYYFSVSSVGNAFEAAGALAILLIAVYYAARIFLFGAVLTRTFAERRAQTAGT
jgi:membrane protein